MADSNTFGILCFATGFGGLEMNTLRLAGWMQERGWTVVLLLREGTAICRQALEEQLRVTVVPAGQSARADLRDIHAWVTATGMNRIFLCYNKDIKIAARYKRSRNPAVRLVYQQHMQVGVSKRDFIHTRRYRMLDAWISPLQYLKQETMEKTRVHPDKIHVIPFGFEQESFHQSTWTREAARQAFSLPQSLLVIGVLGRIDPKKGQDLVVRGIHRLQTEYGIDSHLLLVGDATINEGDAYSRGLRQLITELGLTAKVHLFAYQKDVMQFFRAIDIFAMPAHGETYGMVTLEAMAAGVPVTGTDRDGTRELLQEGRLGYLFPLQDVDAFCRQVVAITREEDIARKCRQASAEVARLYSHEEMCSRISDLLRHLA